MSWRPSSTTLFMRSSFASIVVVMKDSSRFIKCSAFSTECYSNTTKMPFGTAHFRTQDLRPVCKHTFHTGKNLDQIMFSVAPVTLLSDGGYPTLVYEATADSQWHLLTANKVWLLGVCCANSRPLLVRPKWM